ncbi:hypothetical protein sscle_16g109840 [Sclerotinia sclerotiorum 1980 UF-70]|uniref:JmjC domain-containing protein n=1 Tax=Sclerotinia sclerotiorum (strain ATCC 18683 / 1980 / Ss-1) TaxID=665079 RepID=A0A1D9QMP9_SCLS1|nr:hypothetical protein sscle_16g109840 [Sclerotinia sclerotiorum 1980 UF-70]
MPSQQHPRAQFVPLSPNIDLDALVNDNPSFDHVRRLPQADLEAHTVQSLEQLVYVYVIQEGRPLVLEGWGSYIPPWLFSAKWLEENYGKEVQKVRDITSGIDLQMTMGHYLRSMGQLANQFTPQTYRDPKRQRLYLKDIDCPTEWEENLKDVLPEAFFYLNDCIESRTGGDGAIREPNEFGQMRFGKGVAPAGDLMSSLPKDMRALNMMCYIGHEGTYTPAHREMCASLGHNLMVETSGGNDGEIPGSSIWFMTESKEREMVSEWFISKLGHDIEVEKHFAQLNAWRKAPFNVWVTEQRVGDLILIPPLAPHQVWNRGTRTMKAAWNRTTVDTLELAIHEALPRARLVCRDEQYKNKAIIYYTLDKYYRLLSRDTVEPKMWMRPGSRIRQVMEDFKRLFKLYTEVLISELFSRSRPERNVEYLPYDSNVTCSYCRCNIFNRFLTCKSCILTADTGEEEDTYDVCMECYAMGRSCACISCLEWVEQWKEAELRENYELWRKVVLSFEDPHENSPKSLEEERDKTGKKSVAQICQEQLAIRPWKDITKPDVIEPLDGESDVEPEVDDEGRLKKPYRKPSRRGRIQATKNKTSSCHICCHHHWNWQSARCSTCSSSYCYGTLWRAFDLMPQTVMEMENWECPKCLKMCSCARCRRDSKQTPYTPKGTLLGHDTKKVADYRSIESLVDFAKTNLPWLRHEDENQPDPQETGRMRRLREKAERDKAQEPTIDNSYLGFGEEAFFRADDPEDNHFNTMADIDPSLRDDTNQSPHTQTNGFHSAWDQTQEAPEYSIEEQLHQQLGALDAHHDLDDNYHAEMHDPSESAQCPSRLLATVAPMVSTEAAPPKPQTPEPASMMGEDYYPTEIGIDGILYDSPKSDSEPNEMVTVNPADLLASLDQFRNVAKKRKRLNSEGIPEDDDEDVEFFTSKRQRKVKPRNTIVTDIKQESISRSAHRPSRVNKRQDYTEPSLADVENLLSSEEESEPHSTSRQSLARTVGQENDDVDLAAKAFGYIIKGQTTNSAGSTPASNGKKKRGRPSTASKIAASSGPSKQSASVKASRKSTWLSRNEGANDEEEYPSELPATRTRSSRHSAPFERKSRTTRQAVTGASGDGSGAEAESDDPFEDRPRKTRRTRQSTVQREPQSRINMSDNGSEEATNDYGREISDGSLFGNDADNVVSPVSPEMSEDEDQKIDNGAEDPDNKGTAAKTRKAPLAESSIHTSIEGPVIAKKRRGRPPKKAPNTRIPSRPAQTMPKLRSPSSSKSPPPPGGSNSIIGRPSQFLSLREKLALKGKKVKIVSQQSKQKTNGEQQQNQSATPTSKDTSSPAVDSGNKSPVFTPINGIYPHDATSLPKTLSGASSAVPSRHPSTSRNGTPVMLANPTAGAQAESSKHVTPIVNSNAHASSSSYKSISAQPVKDGPTVVRLNNNENKQVKKGPTIVRLMESESESDSEHSDNLGPKNPSQLKSTRRGSYSEESDEEGWSSSDDDIPAVKPVKNVQASPVSTSQLKSPVPARGRGRPPIRG